MKYIFVAVYLLVLATQLPHVWFAYAAIEVEGFRLAQVTAIGAALAFEASTGIFTYRIVKGSRRRWTRWGLMFFIGASIVANGFYYGWAARVFGIIWPVFATVALPFALALFAEEFGAEVKRTERERKRVRAKLEQPATKLEPEPSEPQPFTCLLCGATFRSQAALSGHGNKHKNGHERTEREKEATE